MASNFRVQNPYVLSALPKLLDPSTGRYVVGEVFGTSEGSRKRKRHEATVGIDGEAANIYDVSSGRLITSYPIPPHASFTCPPYSTRKKSATTKEVVRRTYIATTGASPQNITLFEDSVEASGKTNSSTRSATLKSSHPIVYLTAILTTATAAISTDGTTDHVAQSQELVSVQRNGSIIAYDADTLEEKWKTSPAILRHDSELQEDSFRVEHCVSANSSEVIEGIFSGRKDLIGNFLSEGSSDIDHELVLLVSAQGSEDNETHHLHILGRNTTTPGSAQTTQTLLQLHVVPLPTSVKSKKSKVSSYRFDVRSGALWELCDGILTNYDLTRGIPRISQTMRLEGATSFLRLSKSSILASSPSLLSIYNPQYQAKQASVSFDLSSQSQETVDCDLVAYFSRLDLAIAVSDSNLVALQIEAPKTKAKKRKADGLLVDAIGRGIRQPKGAPIPARTGDLAKSLFSEYIPGTIRDDYLASFDKETKESDALLEANELGDFENLLARKFGVRTDKTKLTNGLRKTNDEDSEVRESISALPDWIWPEARSQYPRADRRWVLYGISKVFGWDSGRDEDELTQSLVSVLPYSNLLAYLVDAGHLTTSNIKSALRGQFAVAADLDATIMEDLIQRLTELDPSMELLATYISATTLSSVELLIAVRAIMQSLGLVQDAKQPLPKLLTNGTSWDTETGDIDMDLDSLEQEIQKTESYLGSNAGARGLGLSAAFAKLATCPALSTITALRSTFKPEEISSLVYLLRVELVKGAWTSRYLDSTGDEDADLDAPPDGIIKLIGDLLGRCIDAIGSGGWLLNDALWVDGDEPTDFIASLKLEVSAALEGIEEAVYLHGIVKDVVKYNEAALRAAHAQARRDERVDVTKPMLIPIKEVGAEALPLGLKVKAGIEKEKVVSGGEVKQRSGRETGHLISQRVGPYSLERIAI